MSHGTLKLAARFNIVVEQGEVIGDGFRAELVLFVHVVVAVLDSHVARAHLAEERPEMAVG